MTKRKRSKKKKDLTQEEIWDDSALIQSWDDAVQEYKVSCFPVSPSHARNAVLTRGLPPQLYHSIQARGEDVEEVLRAAEAGSMTGTTGIEDVAASEQPPASFKEAEEATGETGDTQMADAQASHYFQVRVPIMPHKSCCIVCTVLSLF